MNYKTQASASAPVPCRKDEYDVFMEWWNEAKDHYVANKADIDPDINIQIAPYKDYHGIYFFFPPNDKDLSLTVFSMTQFKDVMQRLRDYMKKAHVGQLTITAVQYAEKSVPGACYGWGVEIREDGTVLNF